MSSEAKLYIGVIASALTGVLVALHVVDPAQANSFAGNVQAVAGGLLIVIPPLYAIDGLLFKHKAEVSSQHLLDTPAPTPTEPIAPVEPPAQPTA